MPEKEAHSTQRYPAEWQSPPKAYSRRRTGPANVRLVCPRAAAGLAHTCTKDMLFACQCTLSGMQVDEVVGQQEVDDGMAGVDEVHEQEQEQEEHEQHERHQAAPSPAPAAAKQEQEEQEQEQEQHEQAPEREKELEGDQAVNEEKEEQEEQEHEKEKEEAQEVDAEAEVTVGVPEVPTSTAGGASWSVFSATGVGVARAAVDYVFQMFRHV